MDQQATPIPTQRAPRAVAGHKDQAVRIARAVTPALVPARYVRTHLFEALTGYSPNAIEKKIQSGAWIEGREFKRAPDGHVLVDLRGYERWVENQ